MKKGAGRWEWSIMAGNGPGQRNGPRTRKFLVLFFIIMAVLILASSYVYYQNYEKNYKLEIDHQLIAISDLKANELVDWKTEQMGDAGIFFHNPVFTSRVRDLMNDGNDTETREALKAWFEKELKYNQYVRAYLIDTKGTLRLSVPDTQIPVATPVIRELPRVLVSGNITILDFYRDDHDQKIYLAIIVPIYNDQEQGKPLGFVCFQVDPEIYLYPFIREWPGPRTSAETLVVRREGNDLVYLNDLRFSNHSALTLRVPLDLTEDPAVKAVHGEAGIIKGSDYRGVPVISAIRDVPDTPWSIVVKMDKSEAYGPIQEQILLLIIIVSILLISIGTGICIIWRQESTMFYMEMFESERALRKEREKTRTYLEIVGTAVIAIGPDQAVIMVNPAGCRLLCRSEEEILGKNWFDTFLPVRLREKSREIFFRMMTDATYLPEQVENVIVTAIGEERQVTWHFSLIRDEDQRVTGTLRSGEDITQRKLTEDTLRRVNQKLNVLSQLTRKDLTSQIFILSGYLELAKNQLTGQDQILVTLEQCDEAARLINEVLEYSKDYQDMGVKPPKWQNLKMAMLLGLSHISISEVQYHLEMENLEIFADPLLEKVCQRIFENSVKHGGHVTRIRVWHRITPDGVIIVFEDNGIGIPCEKKEQIFVRGDFGARDSMRSLVFVREILDITGIAIHENGEPGKGARFEMNVPDGAYRNSGDEAREEN